MTLNELAEQTTDFYIVNYDKLKKHFINLNYFEYQDSDLYTISEIISALIFIKIENEFNILNETFEFNKMYESFDVISKSKELEIKCRRKSLNSNIVKNNGGLLKLSKWKYARTKLENTEFIYVNIFHDSILVYNLNDMANFLNKKVKNDIFNYISTDNRKNNENTAFLSLFTFTEYQYNNDLKVELSTFFDIIEKIEIIKQNRNRRVSNV